MTQTTDFLKIEAENMHKLANHLRRIGCAREANTQDQMAARYIRVAERMAQSIGRKAGVAGRCGSFGRGDPDGGHVCAFRGRVCGLGREPSPMVAQGHGRVLGYFRRLQSILMASVQAARAAGP